MEIGLGCYYPYPNRNVDWLYCGLGAGKGLFVVGRDMVPNKQKGNARRRKGPMSFEHIQAGWYINGDTKIWVRSKWERNYCHYLEWLRQLGEIRDWEYEPDEFEFPIKRGTRFYKPDFKVTNNDGTIAYHEVKGHWTGKAKTQVKRFRKYYPDLKLIVIGKDVYKAIAEKKALIPRWE